MSCPWVQVSRNAVKFDDVQSEQLAYSLHEKDHPKRDDLSKVEEIESALDDGKIFNEMEQNDYVIAQMLQCQFDDEHDDFLKRSELKLNHGSKVCLSYDKLLRKNSFDIHQCSVTEEECHPERPDRLEDAEKTFAQIPKGRGYIKRDGQMITKHDNLLNSRMNTSKLMDFEPGFQTGDGSGFDMKLSNRVYNSLKVYSISERNRKARIKDKKDYVTATDLGIDEESYQIIKKLQMNGTLNGVDGNVGTGKESMIFHSMLRPDCNDVNARFSEVAIKVFKTKLTDFKPREKYIKDDLRFKDRFCKQNRKFIHMWAEKEQLNLNRLQRIGIRCPEVVELKKNVLIMSFIGENGKAAPKLKYVQFETDNELKKAYDQIVNAMQRFYQEAQLIHGDLSEFNILWFNKRCWFIDVSQAVEPTHPNSFEFLIRDCNNIFQFFDRKRLDDILTPAELFYKITGEQYSENKPNRDVKASIKNIGVVENEHDFKDSFDNDWEKSKLSSTM